MSNSTRKGKRNVVKAQTKDTLPVSKGDLRFLMATERTKGAQDTLFLVEEALKQVFGFGSKRIEKLKYAIERISNEQLALPVSDRKITGVLRFNTVEKVASSND